MDNKSKEKTVRLVIVGVPESHVRILRIASAKAGNKYMSTYLRKLLAEWAEKQNNNKEV